MTTRRELQHHLSEERRRAATLVKAARKALGIIDGTVTPEWLTPGMEGERDQRIGAAKATLDHAIQRFDEAATPHHTEKPR